MPLHIAFLRPAGEVGKSRRVGVRGLVGILARLDSPRKTAASTLIGDTGNSSLVGVPGKDLDPLRFERVAGTLVSILIGALLVG